MRIIPADQLDKEKAAAFFQENWGSPQMVISTGIYHCDELPGFAAIDSAYNIIGLITFADSAEGREIISLDAGMEGQGIGSGLLKAAEADAKQKGISKMALITTNDNLNALRFYQKRGYQLKKVLRNAVEEARKIKPEIPAFGIDGIPLRDELILEKEI
ncbi:GNAT family N-acetyltransferase [Bacillus infantis]|uniref:GNAT family N-acetyltransferase n=1 Tax=Bacillus infantis TaxID=324767 RepID=A0A5D4SGV3_9BACI|nr:GNAT family N-acetyltransferase [Bacillus infantis]TYS62907.1 GNAT family N-acetyltransferase [Bacillus infantis]